MTLYAIRAKWCRGAKTFWIRAYSSQQASDTVFIMCNHFGSYKELSITEMD